MQAGNASYNFLLSNKQTFEAILRDSTPYNMTIYKMRIYQRRLFEGVGGYNFSNMVHNATLLTDFVDDILDIWGSA